MPTTNDNRAPERQAARDLTARDPAVREPTARDLTTRDLTARDLAAAGLLVALSAAAIAVAPTRDHGLYGTVPASLTAAFALWALSCGRRARHLLAWPLTVLSVLSVATAFTRPRPVPEAAGGWKLAEVFVLLVLVAAVACWSPRREAIVACAAGGVAVALWPMPLVDDASWAGKAEATVFWGGVAGIAVALGTYPRRQAYRGRLAVAAARREQQLELARDLHDFVAHDVSGIVVQAQAARFVAEHDPQAAVQALERIEKAGLNALASMDRTVQMLHDADGAPLGASAPPGLTELPELVERFAAERAERGGRVELDLRPEAVERLSREAGAVAYRVVVEALTNIRRHSSASSHVQVTVRRHPPGIRVAVADDASAPARPWAGVRRRGGRGLVGLRERVAAVGGTLESGPDGSGGWRVTASFADEAG